MSEEMTAQEENKGESLWFGIDPTTCTYDEFEKVTNESPKARDDFFQNDGEQRFVDMFSRFEQEKLKGSASSGQQPAATDPAQPGSSAQSTDNAAQQQSGQTPAGQQAQPAGTQSQTPAEEFVDLTGIKIPKSMLGTYLTGRDLPAAIIAAIDGNGERLKTLNEFRDRNTIYSSKTLDLQKQLIDATVKMKTAEAQPKAVQPQSLPQIDVEEIDFSAINKDDLYDPEKHDSVWGLIEKSKLALANVKKVIETTKAAATAQPSPAPNPYKPDDDPDVMKQRNDLNREQVQRDIFEIDTTVSQIPQLRMSKKFMDVDLEVSSFYDRVKQAAGITGDRMDAVNFYFGNTPDSKIFKDRCTQEGIVPPPDYDKFQVASRAYHKRKKDMAALRDEFRGNPPPQYSIQNYIAMELQAAPITSSVPPQSAQPAVPPQSYDQKIEQHFQQRTAASTPPGVIPDIPPSVGSSVPFAPTTTAEQNAIALKLTTDPDNLTESEANWLYDVCIADGLLPGEIPPAIKLKASKKR